jgi:broad specificity phosphatase PhoE
MPGRIILVRHGESEANLDEAVWRSKADNKIELTNWGKHQARSAGERIGALLGPDDRVQMVVSPFERTLNTANELRKAFESKILTTTIEPRVREQEFGNLQGDDFTTLRRQQEKIG